MGKGHPRTEKSLYLKIGVGTIKSSIRIVELAPNSPASRRRTLDFTHSFLHRYCPGFDDQPLADFGGEVAKFLVWFPRVPTRAPGGVLWLAGPSIFHSTAGRGLPSCFLFFFFF